jgi:hypothetical protein
MTINTRKLWRKLALAALVGGAAGGGIAWSRGGAEPPREDAAEVALAPMSVAAADVPAPGPLPAETAPPPLAPVPVPPLPSVPVPKALPADILPVGAVVSDGTPPVVPAAAMLPIAIPPVPQVPSLPPVPAPVVPAIPLLSPAPETTALRLPVAPAPRESRKSAFAVPVYRPSDPEPLFPFPVPEKPLSKPSPPTLEPPVQLPPLPPSETAGKPLAPVPPLVAPAPPAPPAKSTGLAKPVPAVKSDFNLRPGYAGNSVKLEPSAARQTPAAAPLIEPKRSDFPVRPDTPAAAPGDNPMKFRQTALAALIGGACALASDASAAYPVPPLSVAPTSPVVQDTTKDKTKNKTVEDRLEAIEKKLDRFTELLDGRRDSDGYPLSSDPGLVADLKKLKDDVAKLRQDLDGVQKKSTSLSPGTPGAGTPGAATPAMGTVKIINDYPVEITMMVNNGTYRVAPKAELTVHVPVGEFSYQLLNSGASLTPTRAVITEKEPIRLRVR